MARVGTPAILCTPARLAPLHTIRESGTHDAWPRPHKHRQRAIVMAAARLAPRRLAPLFEAETVDMQDPANLATAMQQAEAAVKAAAKAASLAEANAEAAWDDAQSLVDEMLGVSHDTETGQHHRVARRRHHRPARLTGNKRLPPLDHVTTHLTVDVAAAAGRGGRAAPLS